MEQVKTIIYGETSINTYKADRVWHFVIVYHNKTIAASNKPGLDGFHHRYRAEEAAKTFCKYIIHDKK
jgi:hypothetical protein